MASVKVNNVVRKALKKYPRINNILRVDTLRFIVGWLEDQLTDGTTDDLYNRFVAKVEKFDDEEEFVNSMIKWVGKEYNLIQE